MILHWMEAFWASVLHVMYTDIIARQFGNYTKIAQQLSTNPEVLFLCMWMVTFHLFFLCFMVAPKLWSDSRHCYGICLWCPNCGLEK